MPRWLAGLAGLLLVVPAALAQLSPEKALASMRAADGLQVELFAHEPMLINPTSMDVDHLGRVWVTEAVNYRRKMFNRPLLRPEGDRIVILTDSDGDGKADKSTVFYQGKDLYGPIGIAVAPLASGGRKSPDSGPGAERNPNQNQGANAPRSPCRVFVCQSPDILLFEDKDGDGKADGPPKKFLTGFGGYDHDHGVHGINIGPDGKLYFTVGDQGVKDLQSSDGNGPKFTSNGTTIRAGTVWRCDMDGTHLELIAHNFRNNYECCVNSFGEVWLSDNDDDGNQQTRICFVMPGGNYGYHPRGPGQTHWHEEQPGIVHKTLRTGFGSPTGICFYEGTLLPDKYWGELLHTDAGPRELRSFIRKPKGAGYELEKVNLLTSSDNWFRPSDVCVAPDGSVFVADWYDPGVGGHGMGDWTRGRVYRVTPKGHTGYKVPAVKLDNGRGILDALASPCVATRSLAFAKLRSMKPQEIAAAMQGADVQKPDPQTEARLVWLSPAMARWPEWRDLVKEYFNDPSVQLQSLAVRLMENYFNQLDAKGARLDEVFIDRIKTGKPALSVCRETLIWARKIPAESMKEGFYALAKRYDGQDIFYRAALNIACGTDPKRRDAILADFDKHFPEWNDKVADLVWELRPKSVLPRLAKLLTDGKLTAAQKGRIVDILAVNDDPAAGKALVSLLKTEQPAEVKARALENLRLFLPGKWNALAKSAELRAAISGLLDDPKTKATGLQLIAASNATPLAGEVASIAESPTEPSAVRLEAVRTLGKLRSPAAVASLDTLLKPGRVKSGDPLATEAVHALGTLVSVTGRTNGPAAQQALAVLQKLVTGKDTASDLKRTVLATLAGTRAGTRWLLQLREKQQLPETLVADAGRLLRNSPFQGERNKAMLLFPAPGKLDPKKLPPIAELAKRRGNAENGRKLLLASVTSEVMCLKCHTVRGQGGQIGPDLSMIGKKGSRENLFESILQPSKAIGDGYNSWKIDTLDGQTITGLLVQDSEKEVILRDANGKDYAIPAKDIDRRAKSLVSLMPENIVAALTEEQLVDVVEYLTTLQTAALTPTVWRIAGPFPSPGGNAGLEKEYGPEKAPFDAKAKFQSEPSAIVWRPIRTGPGGYIDLAAFHGAAGANSVSYVYAEFESPVVQEATILLGTDDGAKLSVNGGQVFASTATRAAAPAQETVKVKLKKGVNTVLLKIANGNNPHGFYFTLLSDQEVKTVR
jgi:putative membrane-bound dehydrogenase-like protein